MTPVTDDFQGHLGLAGIITGAIEILKRSNLPGTAWITAEKTNAAVWLSVVAAALTSWGFQLQWEGTWSGVSDLLTNGGSFTVVIPNLDTLVRAAGQVMLQLGTYHGIIKPVVNKS